MVKDNVVTITANGATINGDSSATLNNSIDAIGELVNAEKTFRTSKDKELSSRIDEIQNNISGATGFGIKIDTKKYITNISSDAKISLAFDTDTKTLSLSFDPEGSAKYGTF